MKTIYAITVSDDMIPLIKSLPGGTDFSGRVGYQTHVWIFDPENPADSHVVSEEWTYDYHGHTHHERYPNGLVRIS